MCSLVFLFAEALEAIGQSLPCKPFWIKGKCLENQGDKKWSNKTYYDMYIYIYICVICIYIYLCVSV